MCVLLVQRILFPFQFRFLQELLQKAWIKKKVYMLVGSTNTWKYKHQLFHKKFHWQPLNSVSILKFSLHCYFKVEIIAIIV